MFQPWHTWQLMAAMVQSSKCTAKSWRKIKLLEKRQPYCRLYLFGHKSEGFKISSPSYPISSFHHHLSSPQHTPFQCISPWVFGSAQFPQSPSLNWRSFLLLYFGVSAVSFSATLRFHFPFCELNRLRSTCWCQRHSLSNVSAINSQLHWLSHDQKMWQEVPKADQKAQEFALLVLQLRSLIYAKGSFLVIA